MSDLGAAIENLSKALKEKYSTQQVKFLQGQAISYDAGSNEVDVLLGNSDTPVTIQNIGPVPEVDSMVWIANLGNGRMICVGSQISSGGGGGVNEWHYFEFDSDIEDDSRPSQSLVQFFPVGGGTAAFVADAYLFYEGAFHVNKEMIDGSEEYRLHYFLLELDLSTNWWSNFVNNGGGSVPGGPTAGAQMILRYWYMAPFIGTALIANESELTGMDFQDSFETVYLRGTLHTPIGFVQFNGLSSDRRALYLDSAGGLWFMNASAVIVPLAWDTSGVQSGAMHISAMWASYYVGDLDTDGGPVKATSTWHSI